MSVSAGAADVGFVHRLTGAADIYFVANTSNARRAIEATFRVTAAQAQQWNPLDGSTAPLAVRRQPGQAVATVALDLDPYGSTVVVFPAGPARRTPATGARAAAAPAPIDISAGWKVTFGAAGTPADWAALRSWTEDETTRHFSGVAAYEKTVDVPAAMLRRGQTGRLDLGAPKAIEPGGPRARVQAWVRRRCARRPWCS